jgi:hypothetical protein
MKSHVNDCVILEDGIVGKHVGKFVAQNAFGNIAESLFLGPCPDQRRMLGYRSSVGKSFEQLCILARRCRNECRSAVT